MEEQDKPNTQIELIKNETLPAPIAKNEREGLSGTIAKDANHLALRNTIKVAIMKAYLSLGKQSSKEDLTFLINELHAEVLRVFPGIRLEELGLAIHKTAMGEFIPIEKIYTPSLSLFVTGIRMYMASESRAQAAKEYFNTLLLDKASKPSEKEISMMLIQNAINAYDFYKSNGFYNDYGNSILNFLYEKELIKFTDDQAYAVLKEARKKVFAYYLGPSRSADERFEKKRIIEELRANREHPLFQTEAKKILLNLVFKEMVAANADLKALIS